MLTDTTDTARIQFAIFVIEAFAEKHGLSFLDAYDTLNETDAIESFIIKLYEPLHTQGLLYILESVERYRKCHSK